MPSAAEPGSAVVKSDASQSSEFERRFVRYCIAIALLLAALPCAVGYAASHPGWQFVGAVYNIDDQTVHFAWARQAADGHLFIRNLFTTEPQNPIQFNVLMLLIGSIVDVTHVSIPVVFFVTRIVASGLLLALIYRLFKFLAPNSATARMYGFLFVCFGSGFGWMFRIAAHLFKATSDQTPVDGWQPEAFTFQSAEVSMLFVVSQILIVATIFLLAKGLREGRARYAAGAGVCGLLLGNVHSYDVMHVAAAWLLYLIAMTVVNKRFDRPAWLQAILCAAIAMPSIAYEYHMYVVDPMFHIRAHGVTLSPPVTYYLLGWGVVFISGAGAAAYWVTTRFESVADQMADRSAALLTICWFLGALAISYTPHLNFQRKLIMGADIPISLLGGCGLALLAQHGAKPWKMYAMAACLLLSLPGTLLWVNRDISHVRHDLSNTDLAPFLDGSETAALAYIRDSTPTDSAILGYPALMDFVPAWCDRYTYVSHWGETPDFEAKVAGFNRFVETGIPERERNAYLISTKADYFVFPNALNGLSQPGPDGETIRYEDFHRLPDILAPVYSNKELTIYKILLIHPPK